MINLILRIISNTIKVALNMFSLIPFRRLVNNAYIFQKTHYHSRVIDHYENPRNVGSLNNNDPDVGIGVVGSPACGDVMKLSIRVNKEGIIVESLFKTFGCGSAIASSSYTTEWLKDKTLAEGMDITNKIISTHLFLPPVKLHCSMLAEDAVRAAVKNYEKKQNNNQ